MRAVPRMSRVRSRVGSVPSSASNTCADERSATGMSSSASLKDSAAVWSCGERVGVLVLRGRRLGRERRVEAGQQLLQVLARVALQGRQHLVELDGRGRLRDRDRVPGLQLRRARRSRLEVHEEVALEEDARADLGRRVLVQRERGVLELHHQQGVVGAFDRLDGLDLAHLDARDPHGRVGPDRVRRLELRVEPEAGRERDVLREAEVHDHDDQQRAQQADEGVRAARAAATGAGHQRASPCAA